uniref:Gustatory receptor n=1 Tax=Lutzomyia longipalpis TaxID=7200 RepID=A0A1B0GLQ7_LUTLO
MPQKVVDVMPKGWQKKIFLDEFSTVKVKKSNAGGFNAGFHECMRPVVFVGQCASLFPIKGKNLEDLECSIVSFRMLYACSICLAMLVMCLLSLKKLISISLAYEKFVTVIYYSLLFWACVHFIRMARHWPQLMRRWAEVERSLPQCEHLCNKISTKRKLLILVISVTILTMIEETFSIISGITKAKGCIGIWDSVERYFKQSFPQIFSLVEYHETAAILAQIVQLYSTFIWNFLDMFVMTISIGLSSVVRQFNVRLSFAEGKNMPASFWAHQKRDYQLVCSLVEMMDSAIAHVTVQAFFSNLYYICVQLLNSVNNMEPWTYSVYYWFSLFYLIARTVGMCLFGAEVHTEAKKPAAVLRKIPSEGWNVEAERFLELVTNSCASLTGNGYFFVTKPFLLSLTGTIVTYELVLMQFNEQGTLDSPSSDPCE